MSTRYIDPEDIKNEELDRIPVRNGCSGWCGCTGHCREICATVSREDAKKWQTLRDLSIELKKASNILLQIKE